MKISTKARYAVMAMVDLVKHGNEQHVSLSEIARRQELPLPYLEQLFNKLKKQGIVKSSRGSNGGYLLNHLPTEITVIDVIQAVDPPLKITRCDNHDLIGCRNSGAKCLTHDLWEELGDVIRLFLERVTLADIFERQVRGLGKFSFQE